MQIPGKPAKYITALLTVSQLLMTAAAHGEELLCTSGKDCAQQGFTLYQEGKYTQAKSMLELSCRQNFGVGCFGLGFLYENGLGVMPEYSRAYGYFEKACELQFADGCYYVGLYHIEKKVFKADRSETEKAFKKACDLNHAESCAMTAELYLEKDDEASAKDYLKKACDLNAAESCTKLKKLKEGSLK